MKKTSIPALYNPHNYRLYLTFKKDNFKPIAGMVGVWFGTFQNYGKEFTALGEGIRVTIKKTKAELINKLSEQEWFSINKAHAKEEIISILNKIDAKCLDSFKRFIKIYGGSSDYIILNTENRAKLILNTKCDNKIMNESFINSLPLNMTFETDIVKKVYKHPDVEYKQPIYAATYLENSGLKEFSPEICNALIDIKNSLPKSKEEEEQELRQIETSIKEKKELKSLLEDKMICELIGKHKAKEHIGEIIFNRFGI